MEEATCVTAWGRCVENSTYRVPTRYPRVERSWTCSPCENLPDRARSFHPRYSWIPEGSLCAPHTRNLDSWRTVQCSIYSTVQFNAVQQQRVSEDSALTEAIPENSFHQFQSADSPQIDDVVKHIRVLFKNEQQVLIEPQWRRTHGLVFEP